MTVQEMIDKSLAAHKAGQAIIEGFEKEGGVGTFASKAPKEKFLEAQKHFDEMDSWKMQADALHTSERLKKEAEELKKNPLRKFGFGADDDQLAKQVEYFRNHGILDAADYFRAPAFLAGAFAEGLPRTVLKLDDARFKWNLPRQLYGLPEPEIRQALEAYIRFGAHRLGDAERHALTPLTDQEGGYLVTQEYRTEIIRKLRNIVYMRQLATVIQTSAGSVAFPTFDPADTQTDAPTNLPNSSISQASLSKLFGKTQFTPHSRAKIIPIPVELLEDAVVDVGSLLTDFWALRMAEIEENDFILGAGVNTPFGLLGPLGQGFPGSQSLQINGSTTALVAEDLVNTVYTLRAVYRRDAAWLMHRKVINAIRLIRTNIGGAGTGQFMFQPSMQAGQPPTLDGYSLLESEFMPDCYSGALAQANTSMAMFGNLKFYWIIDRIDLMVRRLNELYAGSNQVGFMLRKRYDAAPILADPFVFLKRK